MKIILQICCIKVTCLLSRAFSTNHSNSPSISSLSFTISLKIYFAMTTEHNFLLFSSPKRSSSTVNMRENIWDFQKQGIWNSIFEGIVTIMYSHKICVHIHLMYVSCFIRCFSFIFFFEETEPHKWVNSCCTAREQSKKWKLILMFECFLVILMLLVFQLFISVRLQHLSFLFFK